MVFASLDAEVDEVSGVSNDSAKPFTKGMINECLRIRIREWFGKPLHIVFYEDLDRRASDADSPLNRSGDTTHSGNMRAEEREQFGRNFTHRGEGDEVDEAEKL